MIKLKDLFNNIFTGGGLFSLLPENVQPWIDNEAQPEVKAADKLALDLQYLGNHSGEKNTSPLIDKLFVGVEEPKITSSNINTFAGIIKVMYLEKWTRLWNVLTSEYDPIENYNMEQTRTPNITKQSDAKTNTNISTTDNEKTEIVTDNDTYAFNSENPTHQSKQTVHGDDDKNEKVSVVEGSWDDNKSQVIEKETGTEDLTRHGNIGVTTTQQMINQELELRKTVYFEEVFKDIDKILTIGIY